MQSSFTQCPQKTSQIIRRIKNADLVTHYKYLSIIISQMAVKLCRILTFGLLTLTSFLFLSNTPSGIEPTQFPQFKLEHQLSEIPNLDLNRLKNARYIELPQSTIQDVAVDKHGNIYVIAGNGPSNIYKIDHQNTSIHHRISSTKGRVIGTALNKEQTLLALVDQAMGLRIFNLKTNQIRTVASQINGTRITGMNSVTFTNDPNILYFTKSCDLSMQQYHLQILYKTGTGKIYQLNLKTGTITLLIDGLQFPNGIVYSEKDNSLYVNQLGLYRVIKIPLDKQTQKSTFTVVVQNLIGYPDNLKITEEGKLWIGIPSLRDKMNIFIDNHPALRKAIINARIPQSIFVALANFSYSGGLKVDPQTGQVIDYLFGPSKEINFVTAVVERHRKVYMTSLKHNVIAVIDYI